MRSSTIASKRSAVARSNPSRPSLATVASCPRALQARRDELRGLFVVLDDQNSSCCRISRPAGDDNPCVPRVRDVRLTAGTRPSLPHRAPGTAFAAGRTPPRVRGSGAVTSAIGGGVQTVSGVSPVAAMRARRAAPSAGPVSPPCIRTTSKPVAAAIMRVQSALFAPPPIRPTRPIAAPAAARQSRASASVERNALHHGAGDIGAGGRLAHAEQHAARVGVSSGVVPRRDRAGRTRSPGPR